MTGFQYLSSSIIFLISLAGGYYPLVKSKQAIKSHDFPKGKAFTSGVFLALSLTVMLPGAFSLWGKILAHHSYPVATYLAITLFIILLGLEHKLNHLKQNEEASPIIIPLIMTSMIGVCSFLLGTALGISGTLPALMIFFAIIAHKGSASFALALTMVKSKMTKAQNYFAFLCFACATPAGIILGSFMHQYLTGEVGLIFKATIISMASGVFLYLATTHGLKQTPFICNCKNNTNFMIMLAGLLITVLVSVLISYAKHMH